METNIAYVIPEVYDIISSWVTKEMKEEGLLHDVKMYISSSANNDYKDPPFIWLDKETIYTHNNDPLRKEMRVELPFAFNCCAEKEDLETSEKYTMEIASRLIASIVKNYRKKQLFFHFEDIILKSIEPEGTFTIVNKSDIFPATRVTFQVILYVDWLKCKRIINGTEEVEDLLNTNGG